jgi:hypothetical protein
MNCKYVKSSDSTLSTRTLGHNIKSTLEDVQVRVWGLALQRPAHGRPSDAIDRRRSQIQRAEPK